MIPTVETLRATAASVSDSVPEGLTRGEISAGLYGLGFVGRSAFAQLRARAVRLVSCYDANPALQGTSHQGLPVYGAGALEESAPDFMFISARHAVPSVSEMLSGLGIAHVSYDAWQVATNFDAFRRVHDRLLDDERSRAVLRAIMMALLTGDKRYCAAVYEKDQYFCLPRFCGWQTESYVDAGAFTGDSAERFLWAQNGVFSKIYAFEPGPRQFAALQARTRRLIEEWALDPDSIELVNAALGETDRAGAASSANGQMTNLTIGGDAGAGDMAVDIVSLDRFLDGRRITFLKADVEGMEMALLKGARETIQRDRPKLGICVYHYPTDIPEITTYLAELVPDYRFALRHHSPQLMETVLYCWTD
jgi:FkbM family methyltransferase